MSALSIRNLRKHFAGTEVLKGIDLDVNDGEFLILVGPSGCGKSTLLNLIAGLDDITSGEIKIGGRVVNDLPPRSRDIAMVFQSYALYPTMTVRENISFGLEMRNVSKAERTKAVAHVTQILQIEHLLDRKPSQLSGGQRQRVAMGRAIARNPTLFLFDEPLSNLDAKLRVEMRTEIKLLHQRLQTTVVYVTHDQVEAMTLGDKIAVMQAGRVEQFGSPQEIYDNPVNLFVAGFMGSPSMNFIRAPVVTTGPDYAIALHSNDRTFTLPLPKTNKGLKERLGKEIIFGIRPEQITQKAESRIGSVDTQIAALRVQLTEPTGADTLVLVEINETKVTCRVHPAHVKRPGEDIELVFDMSKAVFFDPQTKERVV